MLYATAAGPVSCHAYFSGTIRATRLFSNFFFFCRRIFSNFFASLYFVGSGGGGLFLFPSPRIRVRGPCAAGGYATRARLRGRTVGGGAGKRMEGSGGKEQRKRKTRKTSRNRPDQCRWPKNKRGPRRRSAQASATPINGAAFN